MKKKRKPSYLSFRLGKENYAVSTTKVLEVLDPLYVTPIPNSSDYIRGVISFRGNVVPVICLRKKINLDDTISPDNSVIIIFDILLNNNKTIVAAMADTVNEVIPATDDQIISIDQAGLTFNTTYILGAIKHNEEFNLLFDIDKVLAIEN